MRETRDLLLAQSSRKTRTARRTQLPSRPTLAGESLPCAKWKGPPRQIEKASRPTVPCDGPRMNPSVDVGNPPRPFRHLRMAERCSPDPSSSRVRSEEHTSELQSL